MKIHVGMKGRFSLCLICCFLILPVSINAQNEKKYIRKGNREYDKKSYSESEILYRKAGEKNNQSPEAVFNIGDALYRQNKYEDAGKQFLDNASQTDDAGRKAAGWYNLGNSLLQANKVKESIDAYKNSLKLNPGNTEAKYNLGFAQNLLKQQEQQQQQQQQNKQDKDQDQNKDQNKDQKDDKNKDQENQDKNDKQQQQQQQQQQEQQQISKEDAERILNALANDEKEVQQKVKLDKAAKSRVRAIKNW
jgi:Ca-activated chloride channel homolog